MKPISELAKEIFSSSSRSADTAEAIRALTLALDTWQASVEGRLASMQNMLDVMGLEPSPESERELMKINELIAGTGASVPFDESET